jgi:hypothetical protein
VLGEARFAVYDPATNRWTTRKPLARSRPGAASAVLDGKLYVMGGRWLNAGEGWETLDITIVYDPVRTGGAGARRCRAHAPVSWAARCSSTASRGSRSWAGRCPVTTSSTSREPDRRRRKWQQNARQSFSDWRALLYLPMRPEGLEPPAF